MSLRGSYYLNSMTDNNEKKMVRKSVYPMLDVTDALGIVLKESEALNPIDVPIFEATGLICSDNVFAKENYPTFRASIMDGYCLFTENESKIGKHDIQSRIHAGNNDKNDNTDMNFSVAYITTGARLPDWANAVIKVEDTEYISENAVFLKGTVKKNENIRQIGSDMEIGTQLVTKNQRIGPIEVGLLAQQGYVTIKCYPKPKIGVMSTGDELVESHETPLQIQKGLGSQIRDCNRPMLMSSIKQSGYSVCDLGIVNDVRSTLVTRIKHAVTVQKVDVIITSGGVSMGDSDFLKSILEEMGKIHFGRINMKPGKPTTFASITVNSGSNSGSCSSSCKRVFVFALPGNPVSCMVTKTLLVSPALRRLEGQSMEQALPEELEASLFDTQIHLDRERWEYHRVSLTSSTKVTTDATTTGNQRSSRLQSLQNCQGLAVIPKKGYCICGMQQCDSFGNPVTSLENDGPLNHPCKGCGKWLKKEHITLEDGDVVNIIPLEGGGSVNHTSKSSSNSTLNTLPSRLINYNAENNSALSILNRHFTIPKIDSSGAKVMNTTTADSTPPQPPRTLIECSTTTTAVHTSTTAAPTTTSSNFTADSKINDQRIMKIGILTISDRASQGVYADTSGDVLKDIVSSWSFTEFEEKLLKKGLVSKTLTGKVVNRAVVSDNIEDIQKILRDWSKNTDNSTTNNSSSNYSTCCRCDLILTCGGTGFGKRDFTPEAVRGVIFKEAPGIAQAMLNAGLEHTPLANLSRPVVGVINNTLIATLPGSEKAVKENVEALQPLLPRIMELIM